MAELESEIQSPTGIWTVPPPKLSVTGVLLSKECGILYELTNTEGLRHAIFVSILPSTNFSERWQIEHVFPESDNMLVPHG
jgi:hypothetical protein